MSRRTQIDAGLYGLWSGLLRTIDFCLQKLQTTRHVFVYTYIPAVVVVLSQIWMIC